MPRNRIRWSLFDRTEAGLSLVLREMAGPHGHSVLSNVELHCVALQSQGLAY